MHCNFPHNFACLFFVFFRFGEYRRMAKQKPDMKKTPHFAARFNDKMVNNLGLVLSASCLLLL